MNSIRVNAALVEVFYITNVIDRYQRSFMPTKQPYIIRKQQSTLQLKPVSLQSCCQEVAEQKCGKNLESSRLSQIQFGTSPAHACPLSVSSASDLPTNRRVERILITHSQPTSMLVCVQPIHTQTQVCSKTAFLGNTDPFQENSLRQFKEQKLAFCDCEIYPYSH